MQHGLVFPWSPPIGSPQHVKEKILDFLANHVADHLDRVISPNADKIGRETMENQTPSGSEPHSTSNDSSNPKDSDDSSDAELEESQDDAEDENIPVHTESDFHSTGNPDEDDEDDSGIGDNEVADEDVREVEEVEMEEGEEEPIQVVGDS
ncbi:hypothetical protein FRC05_002139 [Tulasnella sp. 425]|nr:hypothetical protein FRC05_002139 [Tulasnella sp. 425]